MVDIDDGLSAQAQLEIAKARCEECQRKKAAARGKHGKNQ
jgi:hypothetical protein